MSSIHDDDAAYVLGALSHEDRLAFEAHLAECADCRASVAELAGMPALLSRLPADEAAALLTGPTDALPAAPPPELLGRLARRVRRVRRVRRGIVAGTVGLAAAALAAAVVLPMTGSRAPEATARVTLEQIEPGPLSATVALTAHGWGTSVDLDCRYAAAATSSGTPSSAYPRWHYALYVTNASGEATRVASWTAAPGDDVHATGSVDSSESDLASVEIRDAQGDVLLKSPVK